MRINICVFCGLRRQKHFKKYNGGIACHECYRKHIELREEAKKIRDVKISKGLAKLMQSKIRKTLLSKIINS